MNAKVGWKRVVTLNALGGTRVRYRPEDGEKRSSVSGATTETGWSDCMLTRPGTDERRACWTESSMGLISFWMARESLSLNLNIGYFGKR